MQTVGNKESSRAYGRHLPKGEIDMRTSTVHHQRKPKWNNVIGVLEVVVAVVLLRN